ncbi:MAG: hypothetical protein RBJ76_00725 [Stenomitos frigidus ULC029]
MNTEELTQVVTAHQSAVSRHDTEMAEIRAILAATAQQQTKNTQAIAQLTAEQQLSRQDIKQLTASILDLRNSVANYIQNRSGAA